MSHTLHRLGIVLLVTLSLFMIAAAVNTPTQAEGVQQAAATSTPVNVGFRGSPSRILDQLVEKKYLTSKTGELAFEQATEQPVNSTKENTIIYRLLTDVRPPTETRPPADKSGAGIDSSTVWVNAHAQNGQTNIPNRVELPKDLSHFVFSANITWKTQDQPQNADACGFIFHYTGDATDHTMYAVLFVRWQALIVNLWDGSRWRPLVQKGVTVNRQSGASNQLLILAQKSDIKLFMNGDYIAVFQADKYTSGQVGMAAASGNPTTGMTCIFRDLWVWQLNPSEAAN